MTVTDPSGPSGRSLPFVSSIAPTCAAVLCEGEGRGWRDAVCVVGSCLACHDCRDS